MDLLDQDYDDIVVDFTVRVAELNDGPEESLSYEINATIQFVDAEAAEQVSPIGSLTAHLFDVGNLREADASLFDAYDMRSQHLTETYEKIADIEEDDITFRVCKAAGFADSLLIQWHLHVSGLYVQPEFRSARRGVRALKLRHQYAQRPGLLASARAFPAGLSEHSNPTGPAIASLARYYLSEKNLGFKPLGRLDQGWLVANWST